MSENVTSSLKNRLIYTEKTDERTRMRAVANNLILHLHPTKVPAPALVDYIRAWEPTATWVENPRGTEQGPTIHVRGDVVSADGNRLAVITAESAVVEAMLGPPWFWSENGIPLTPGDQVEFEGFQSAEHMELNWLTNQTTGQTIQLRTPQGAHVWGGGN